VSIAIVPALERLQSPELTAAVIERLPHLTPVVLAYLAWTMRRSGAPIAASIVELLRDADGPATVRLAEFGAHLGDPSLRASFVTLAEHGDREVRARAALGLASMPGDEVVVALERLARDDAWQVRLQAIKALGRIAAPACLGTLRDALSDPIHWVRLRAGGALARLGDPGRQALAAATAGENAAARDVARLMLSLPAWSLEDVTA
jgi:HEAT repeat protein